VIRRTLALLRNEIDKACRAKIGYLGVAAVCFVCVVVFLTIETDDIGFVNAWGYLGMVMQAVFAEVGLIFIALFSATLFAEEISSGTIRTALATPVLRREFFVAKTAAGLLYMLVMSLSALTLSMVLAAFKYPYGPIADSVGVVYGTGEVLRNFAFAFALSWVPLAAVVVFGVFVSAVTSRPGLAIGIVVGTIIVCEAIKHFIAVGPFLFTTYIGASWVVFHEVAQGVDYQWRPDVWKILGVPLAYGALMFGSGLVCFCRRDLNV